jgi:hypothetical protein
VEVAWNLYGNTNNDSRVRRNAIHDTIQGRNAVGGTSQLLRAVLARDDMRAYFANTLVDIMDGALAPENVHKELDNLIALHRNEVRVSMLSDKFHPGHSWPNLTSVANEHNIIRDFATRRGEFVLGHINTTLSRSSQRLNPATRYAVEFSVGSGGNAVMNQRPVGESQSAVGNYFEGTAVRLTARPQVGYEIDFWTVNGERVNGDSVTVDAAATVAVSFRQI